jgi:hypothetical protein
MAARAETAMTNHDNQDWVDLLLNLIVAAVFLLMLSGIATYTKRIGDLQRRVDRLESERR